MKRIVLILSFLAIIRASFGQGSIRLSDKPFNLSISMDSTIQNLLYKQESVKELDEEERETMYWINYMRKDPPNFYLKVIIPFLQQFPEAAGQYAESLKRDLLKTKPLPLLSVSSILNRTARSHARDLGRAGKGLSHSSTNGASFQDRMKAAGIRICAMENVYSGKKSGLEAVVLLLIDKGVSGAGHRKALMDSSIRSVGVGFHQYDGELYIQVQDFSCE